MMALEGQPIRALADHGMTALADRATQVLEGQPIVALAALATTAPEDHAIRALGVGPTVLRYAKSASNLSLINSPVRPPNASRT